MSVAVYVPLHTARTLWPKGGVYPVLVPRYMLVPRNTMRSMHKVMRFVHGLRYWLGLILLGHTHPPHAMRLCGLVCGLLGSILLKVIRRLTCAGFGCTSV
jgi:tetrahydromethanopterin S-methyltransferase subunit F